VEETASKRISSKPPGSTRRVSLVVHRLAQTDRPSSRAPGPTASPTPIAALNTRTHPFKKADILPGNAPSGLARTLKCFEFAIVRISSSMA